MLALRLDHTAVFVRDLAASVAWYSELLGLPAAYVGDTGNNIPGAFFDVGDTILALLVTADPGRDLGEQHFAFAVEDVDATYEELLQRGYDLPFEPETLTGGYIVGQRAFDVHDPDGARIEFVQRANIVVNPNVLHPEREQV